MRELEEQITKINTLIKNHTDDIKKIKEKITEYNNKPSTTVNSKKIAGLNTLIDARQKIIKGYIQQLKKLKETKKQVEGGVESIEEEKEREEEKEEEKEREEEKEEEKEETGFRETLVLKNVSTGTIKPNTNLLCQQIFNIGKKVNNKFFIPSQFPNLTKKKSLLKGGRKHMKTKNRNRKEISRKGISRKGISRNKRKSVKNLAL